MKVSKFERLAHLLSGDALPDRYKLRLRPSEELLLWAIGNNDAININKLINDGVDENSIRVTIARLRKKLPTGVKIETKYGGYYYMTAESKKILRRFEKP